MSENTQQPTPENIPFLTIFLIFLRLGLTSFGGPVAHIGYFRREFVDQRHWLSESTFTQLLAICQFLPGPASSQLGFAIGMQRGGWLGGLAAFSAFTLPSAFLLLLFALGVNEFVGLTPLIQGLKLVAVAVVADALLSMARNLCPDRQHQVIALMAISLIALIDTSWSQLIAVAGGAMLGFALCRQANLSQVAILTPNYRPRSGVIAGALFAGLLMIALINPFPTGTHGNLFLSFYEAGALVFGGGHVVLPLLESAVVDTGLVSSEAYLAGYGAAQAVPGPMFTFTSYLGAVINTSSPIFGATIALIGIFLPGFLLLIAVLPLWKKAAEHRGMAAMVSGVNAAVVGLLACAFYDPVITSGITSMIDFTIVTVAFVALHLWRMPAMWVILFCIMCGILLSL